MRLQKGFSLIQLVLITAILGILAALISFAPDPALIIKKQRDATRLSDLSALVVAVESYIADFSIPPDEPNIVRVSNIPVVPGSAVDDPTGKGWVGAALSQYLLKLRLDPLNSPPFVYRYKHDGQKFKFDAILEAETNLIKNSVDGGVDETHFEVGSGKEIVMSD